MEPFDTLVMDKDGPNVPLPARYSHAREIGRGGMSVVYQARDTETDRLIAVKILTLPPAFSPEQSQDLIARFAREAQAVSLLSHPNIVAISEVGTWQGTHFLAMERLEGETLRARLDRGPLPPAQAQGVVVQIASALDAIHAAGIVHRDVKPANIMLLPGGAAKLLDFGIARHADDATITSTGTIVGSPAYMAPEQVMGQRGTARSDVWALGVLLYEMLAGRPPFTGDTIPSVLYQVTHTTPPRIPGLPAPLHRVLQRALAKDPQRRYPEAGALASALREARLHVSAPHRVPAPAPRPKRGMRLLIALSLLVVAGAGLGKLALFYRPGSPVPAVPPRAAGVIPAAPPPAVRYKLATAYPPRRRAKPRLHPVLTPAKRHAQRLLAAKRAHVKAAAKHHAALVLRARALPRAAPHHARALPPAALHRAAARRRFLAYRRNALRRFRGRRQARPTYDRAATERLEHFIWSGGR